jgi:hypothetical protein
MKVEFLLRDCGEERSIPQGLKPPSFTLMSGKAKAKALAYLEARTDNSKNRSRSSAFGEG